MEIRSKVHQQLKSAIKEKYDQDATKADYEGGFTRNIQDNAEGLKLLKAIHKAGYDKVEFGMVSEFYDDFNFTQIGSDPSKWLTGKDW